MKLKGSCHCKSVRFELLSHTPYPYMYCYCSICRKTAGGGGYAINIMGQADTLKIKGKNNVQIYHAVLGKQKGKIIKSRGERHFCKKCASYLWVFDPEWPLLVHPFASAIDSQLPRPPDRNHIMQKYAANWCDILQGKHEFHFPRYPDESIEAWHERHKLLT